MREIGKKIKCTALEITTILMEVSIPESGIAISMLDVEDFSLQMELYMREAGKIISCTVQASSQITWGGNGSGSIERASTRAESKLSW